jgi:actin-like ATPase involved in cell morphogenesis
MPEQAPSQIGRYRILRELGRSVFAALYHARDDAQQHEVILKVLEGPPADGAIRTRFHHEAELLSRLRHPNVPTLYERGEDQGVPYFAFEFLHGMSLGHAVNAGISLRLSLPAIVQVLAGLAYVHEQGVVHCDIKPANIFIQDDGPVKIMDFGVARLATAAITAGNIVGTADYMSPEQVKGLGIDGRSDLFSVGCVLYELVAGRRPFHSDKLVAIFYKIIHSEPDMGLITEGSQWERLRSVITRALKKNAGDRYPDALAMSKDLELALKELGEKVETRELSHEVLAQLPRKREAGSVPVLEGFIAIDLGTTKSCVAVMEMGVPQVIPNQHGARSTPSLVGFTAKGERLVGCMAKRQTLTNPKNTVIAVKRIIGRKFDSPEVARARHLLPYELARAANGDVHIQIGDKVYSPAEISGFVLQKLKAAAEDYLGERVEKAIITVPAYFNDAQREATKEAGLIAGFGVISLVNEPAAAALASGLCTTRRSEKFVAVYDLGGGTFDITILEMAKGLIQVRATSSDTFLGGEDFDQRIIDWLIAEFQPETGIDPKWEGEFLQWLKEVAERAKCELSTAQQTEIVLPYISADASGPKHLKTVLSRQRYEELTDDLPERTIEPCKQCLSDAGLTPEQIDEVLLVGGQTRAPKISEVVRRIFGKEPNRTLNPDEAVAVGAAIQAGITQARSRTSSSST